MFSFFRCFRNGAAHIAAVLCLLALWGCSAPGAEGPAPAETTLPVPSLPSSAPEDTQPPASAPTAAPETLPEEPAMEETGFIRPSVSITAYRRPDSSGYFFAMNETPVPGEITGGEISHSMATPDGSILALLTDRNGLWLIREGELLMLCRNAVYADLSLSGTYLLWIDSAGTLTGYDIAAGEAEVIASGAASASVSPLGKTVAYSVSNPDGSISAWVRTGGEARPFGEELMPFALAENAELVYALGTQDGRLHILDETGSAVSAPAALVPGQDVFLSSDHRQILFPCREGWYFQNAGRGIVLDAAPLKQAVTPNGASILQRESISITSLSLPTENLLGHFYLDTDHNLWYLDTDAELSAVSQTVDTESICISWDGTTLFYRWEDGTLFRTQRSCPGSPTILAAEVEAFAPTWDGAGVYCLDRLQNLWYLEDFHEPKAVAEGVTDFTVTWEGYCLYLTAPGEEGSTLWVSQQGGPGTPTETGAAALDMTPAAVYLTIIKEEQLDLYCATEAFAFLLLAENVM